MFPLTVVLQPTRPATTVVPDGTQRYSRLGHFDPHADSEALPYIEKILHDMPWGVHVDPSKAEEDTNPAKLIYSSFPHLAVNNEALRGLVTANGGVKIESVETLSKERVQTERTLRMAASGGATVFDAISGAGLIASGANLFGSSILGLGDVENSYSWLSRSFRLSSVGGILTGLSKESGEWALGNLGMGLFSGKLDTPLGLGLFSISDGLSAIGIGNVRYRKNQNAFVVQNSIFNSPQMSKFRFLQPIEQSFVSFYDEIKNLRSINQKEPYSLFRAAGGGLVGGGALLSVLGPFKGLVSERLQNLPYLFYSALSSLNLFAFFKDGKLNVSRTKSERPAKHSEEITQYVDGYSKQASVPFLFANNLLLGLKGLGLDASGGFYNAAMSLRSIGAGLAMFGFGAETVKNFFKPVLFGPRSHKEIVTAKINPKICLEELYKVVQNRAEHLKNNGSGRELLNQRYIDVLKSDNKIGANIQKIIDLPGFQGMRAKSQVGFPSISDDQTHDRLLISRYDHSVGVGAFAKAYFDALLGNPMDEKIKVELLDYEVAFKVAALIHDMGHVARSHIAEQAVPGHKDERRLYDEIENPTSELHQALKDNYGEKVVKQILEIMSRRHFLYKAIKDVDRMEYQGSSDVQQIRNPVLSFFEADIDSVKEFAGTVRLFYDSNGRVEQGYTEEGEVMKLLREYARQIHYNNHDANILRILEAQLPFCIGLAANKQLTLDKLSTILEPDADRLALKGLESLSKGQYRVRLEVNTGGEFYTGYSPADKNNRILVVNGHVTDILDYIENKIKVADRASYDRLQPIIQMLTTHKRTEYFVDVSTDFNLVA